MTPLRVWMMWAAIGVGLAGCSGEDPTTMSHERRYQGVFTPLTHRVFVVEPRLMPVLAPRLTNLVRGMVLGEVDDVPGQDEYAETRLSIGITTPAGALQLTNELACLHTNAEPASCPFTQIPQVHYNWAPYGFGDDIEAFVARAACWFGSAPETCARDEWTAEEERFARASCTELWIITDRDVCAGPECDRASDVLLQQWRDNEHVKQAWLPFVIAGLPADKTTLDSWDGAVSREDYLAQLMADPRLAAASEQDICAGNGPPASAPAHALLERLTEIRGAAAASICMPDFRPTLGMVDCGGAFDAAPIAVDPAESTTLPDGTPDCELEERLPLTGPITRCEQLSAFGRDAIPLRQEDGAEVCRVQRLPEATARTGGHFGWFLTRDLATTPAPFTKPAELWPDCFGILTPFNRHFAAFAPTTDPVPRSGYALACRSPAEGG